MVAQACLGLSDSQLLACQKAFEAAGKQSVVIQNVQLFEDRAGQIVYEKVSGVTGETVLVVFGTAATAVRAKALTYPLVRDSAGVIPSVVPTLGVQFGLINLGWRF